jgi:hypothetical protein
LLWALPFFFSMSLQVLDHLFKLLQFYFPAWRGVSFRLACWVCCWFHWSNNWCNGCISSWQDGMYFLTVFYFKNNLTCLLHIAQIYITCQVLKQFIASV